MAVSQALCATSCAQAEDAVLPSAIAAPEPTAVAANAGAAWCLRLPKEEQVLYRGVVSFDSAGIGGGQMMYPAVNAASFVAAIVTHGFIVGGIKKGQKDRMQAAADEVLTPYKEILDSYRYADLMERGLEKSTFGSSRHLVANAEKSSGEIVVESLPVFSVTQDRRALIVDNVVLVQYPGSLSGEAYRNTIRVVSRPRSGEDTTAFWTQNQGLQLKAESEQLFAQSLDLALADAQSASMLTKNTGSFKTVRYLEGETKKMERGQVISEECQRVVLRNLRGWIMSVPTAADVPPEPICASAPRVR